MAAKAKAADKPKAKGNKDKWLQLLRGYEGFSCCEADKKGKVISIYDPCNYRPSPDRPLRCGGDANISCGGAVCSATHNPRRHFRQRSRSKMLRA